MFGVDIGGDAALLLDLGHDMQRQRGLAGGFRAVDLDHAAARQAADAERDVEAERAGGNRVGRQSPRSRLPSFITEPLPKARSIWLSAASSARLRSDILFLANHPQSRLCHACLPVISQRRSIPKRIPAAA